MTWLQWSCPRIVGLSWSARPYDHSVFLSCATCGCGPREPCLSCTSAFLRLLVTVLSCWGSPSFGLLHELLNSISVLTLQSKGFVFVSDLPSRSNCTTLEKLIIMVFTVMYFLSETVLHFYKEYYNKSWHFSRAFCEDENFYYYHWIIVHTFQCKFQI